VAFHRIVSLEVDDGFLKDQKVEFAQHLTCIIGSRGSGKTTLLEFLRFALNQPPHESVPGALRKLLDKNLKPGRVRLVVEDAEGKRYIVDRFAGDPPKVFEEGTGRALVGGWDSVFRADVFTQPEIAQIAEEPAQQLALLDGFAVAELSEVEGQRQTIEHQLQELAQAIGTEAEQSSGLQDVKSQIEANAKRLVELRPPDSELTKAKDDAIAAQVLRKKEARELATVSEHLAWSEEELRRVGTAVSAKLDGQISGESLAGQNGSLLQPIDGELRVLRGHVDASFENLIRRFELERERVAVTSENLEELHLVQDAAADEVLKQDGEARERLTLEKQQADLLVKREAQQAMAASRDEKLLRRQQLVDDLASVIDMRTSIRQREATRLSALLEAQFGVRIQLRPGDDTSVYAGRVEAALRGSKKHGQKEIVQKLLRLEPRSLVKHIIAGKKQALARDSGLSEELAGWVISRLQDHEDLLELQATTNDDTVQIQFEVSGLWKATQSLSTGQKCSAVLPILMLQNARPLVADEPESHLDQRTLVERLIEQIRGMKGTRQLILATHNPNIVALGDNGDTTVALLSCDGERATVAHGTVDDMRREIESLLEGGKEAFKRRGELYAR